MPKRLSYRTLVDDARAQGLAVTGKAGGRHEIDAGTRGLVVYLVASSWAFRRRDEGRRPMPCCRLREAYAYLGVDPGPGLFPDERALMRNAMGLLHARKPYRNHFLCPEDGADGKAWAALCARGLAVSGGKTSLGTFFHVTRAGAEAYGTVLKDEDVPEPVPDFGTPPKVRPEGDAAEAAPSP